MKEDNVTLVDIDIEEFKNEIYSYYLEIFPEDERKPLKMIKNSYDKGYSKIKKIMNNTDLVGFLILNRLDKNKYADLDYLAIFPEYRNMGFGTKAIEILIKQEKESNGIFIEIEKIGLGKNEKENIDRIRRQKFYEQLGFKKLQFDLNLYGVIYMPYVYSNIDINENLIIKEIFDIYYSIAGKEKIEENCEIIKN